MTKYTEIDCRVITTTAKAALVEFDDGKEIWIPLSQIEDNGENLDKDFDGTLYVEEWFAEKEGLA